MLIDGWAYPPVKEAQLLELLEWGLVVSAGPTFPPTREVRRSSMELRPDTWERLTEIAKAHKATSSKHYTRDEVAQLFLDWAIGAYEANSKSLAEATKKRGK